MDVRRLQLDHVVEADLPTVDAGQELYGDRDLIGRGHGESTVGVQPDAATGLYVHGRHPDRQGLLVRRG